MRSALTVNMFRFIAALSFQLSVHSGQSWPNRPVLSAQSSSIEPALGLQQAWHSSQSFLKELTCAQRSVLQQGQPLKNRAQRSVLPNRTMLFSAQSPEETWSLSHSYNLLHVVTAQPKSPRVRVLRSWNPIWDEVKKKVFVNWIRQLSNSVWRYPVPQMFKG